MARVEVNVDWAEPGQLIEVGFLGLFPNGKVSEVPDENLVTWAYHGGVVPDDGIIRVPGEFRDKDVGPAQPGLPTQNQLNAALANLEAESNYTPKSSDELAAGAHEPEAPPHDVVTDLEPVEEDE